MRTFLAVLRVIALLGVATAIFDPTWVSSQVPDLTIATWTDIAHRDVLLGVVLGILGAELLGLVVFLFSRDVTSGGVGADEAAGARASKVHHLTPKEQWISIIDRLNSRDKVGGKQHHPRFAVTRSRKWGSITVLLSDTDFDYHDEEAVRVMGSWTISRESIWIDEAKIRLMHKYLTAMLASTDAREESRDAAAQRVTAEADKAGTPVSGNAVGGVGVTVGTYQQGQYLGAVPKA